MSSTVSTGFTEGVVSEIHEKAYKMLYEAGLTRHLCKPVGQGAKGDQVKVPYFNPTTFAAAASVLTEANDFTTTTALTNASVIITASEFGIGSFLTDVTRESSIVDIKEEIARQQAIGVSAKLENHILAAMGTGFVTGTVTGTNSTTGFTFSDYAKARAKLKRKILTVPGRKSAVIPEYSWYYTAVSTFSQTYASAMGSVGNKVLDQYHVQTLFGDTDVYFSNYIADATAAVGFMFVRDAIGLWTPRDYKLEPQRDASARGDELISTMRAGAKVMIGAYGVRMKMYSHLT